MKFLTHALLLVAALATPAAAADLSLQDRAALANPASASLSEQRAAGVTDPAVTELDRSSLASAQQQAPDLCELRAGDLNDHDLKIIGITVAVVLVIVIIA